MSEQLSVTGTVKTIGQLQSIQTKDGSTITKQEVLLTIGDKYPQDIPFEFFNDKTQLVGKLNQGGEAELYFNLKSFVYKDIVRMGSPQVWRVEAKDTAPTTNTQATAPTFKGVDGSSDLPF